MVSKAVTQEDLLRSRVEITKEQQDARHLQATNMQTLFLTFETSMENKMDKLLQRFDAFESKMETKFASKWTEKVLITILSAVWLAIIGALMALIIK